MPTEVLSSTAGSNRRTSASHHHCPQARRRKIPHQFYLARRCPLVGFLVLVLLLVLGVQVHRFLSSRMASSMVFFPQTRSLATTLHRQQILANETGVRGIIPRAEIRALGKKHVRTPKLGSFLVSTRDSSSSSQLVGLKGALRYAAHIRASADISARPAERLPKTLESDFEALRFTNYANWIIPGVK
eukprot:318064-Pyramimonas_sp.AAC.2